MKARMLRLLIGLISVLAVFIATTSSAYACPWWFMYQPKAPKSLTIED